MNVTQSDLENWQKNAYAVVVIEASGTMKLSRVGSSFLLSRDYHAAHANLRTFVTNYHVWAEAQKYSGNLFVAYNSRFLAFLNPHILIINHVCPR
jgi:hypothetical protein